MNYLDEILRQEDEPLYNSPESTLAFAHDAKEMGGGQDIGYGHKLTTEEAKDSRVYGIDISQGITKDEARNIAAVDRVIHKERARQKVGEDTWRALPEQGKNLLTDYSYTGTLNSFPKMFEALKNKDKEGVLKEYHRKYTDKDGNLQMMGRRNELSYELINNMDKYFMPEDAI